MIKVSLLFFTREREKQLHTPLSKLHTDYPLNPINKISRRSLCGIWFLLVMITRLLRAGR